jgi:nickel-dependent lactate racemase
VFPAFSDTKSLERYRSPTAVESVVQRKRLRKDADEVGWMLGAAFTVQVVPGAGEQILHVLAGDPQAVFTRGQALSHEAWSFSVPHRAELVVASIEGNAAQQTWDNVARALWTASRAVADDGVIALCTELGERFGPALQRIAGADDLHEAMQEIIKVRPADALPATQLVHALERVKVYLLSRLDENLVEELGVAPVADEHQLKRLVEHHESCIVLSNAHYAVTTVEDES